MPGQHGLDRGAFEAHHRRDSADHRIPVGQVARGLQEFDDHRANQAFFRVVEFGIQLFQQMVAQRRFAGHAVGEIGRLAVEVPAAAGGGKALRHVAAAKRVAVARNLDPVNDIAGLFAEPAGIDMRGLVVGRGRPIARTFADGHPVLAGLGIVHRPVLVGMPAFFQ
jgi:hypothetical protein